MNTRSDEDSAVKEAIAARDAFLERYPHMRLYQKEIDRLVSATLSPTQRLDIIFLDIGSKLQELSQAFTDITNIAQTALKAQKL